MNIRLAARLDEVANLLEQNGDAHWADWLRKDSKELMVGNIKGAEHFLSAFGGMGSISDYYGILGPNKPEEEKSIDEKIADRLYAAAEIAARLIRDQK